jgi:hypothetical protein
MRTSILLRSAKFLRPTMGVLQDDESIVERSQSCWNWMKLDLWHIFIRLWRKIDKRLEHDRAH